MAIKSFTFDPALAGAFLDFGYDLYRGDTRWVAPLRRDLYAQMGPEFPFYGKPGNSHRHFLAFKHGKVVGRVSAMVNRDLRDRDSVPVGTIGFFECVDDYEVARELLYFAKEWLCKEHGMRKIWGPMNFDIWHGYRLMTRGFDRKPFLGEPYNKPYYQDFLERYGFTPRQHWVSVEVWGREELEKMIGRGAMRYEQLVGKGYQFSPLNTHDLTTEIHTLYGMLVQSFGHFLGFTPITPEQFDLHFFRLRPALDSRMFTFIRDEKGVLSGFAGAYLDLASAVQGMNGRDHITSRIQFLLRRRHADRVVFYIGGMTAEEAAKRSGLGRAGFYYIIHQAMLLGYTSVVVALMAEGNPVLGLLGGKAAHAQRQYSLYELNR